MKFFLIALFSLGVIITHAQENSLGKLKYQLSNAASDTEKASALDSLSMYYMFYTDKYDSSFYYINQYIDYAFNLKNKKYIILAYARLGFYYLNTSQYNAGLAISLKGLQLSEQYSIRDYLSALYYNISFIYYNLNDSALSVKNAFNAVHAFPDNKDPFYDIPLHIYGHLSSIYADGKNADSALYFLHLMDSTVSVSAERAAKDISYYYWVNYYSNFKDYKKEDSVITLGIASCEKNGDFLLKSFYLLRAGLYYNQGKYRQAIMAAKLGTDSMDIAGQAGLLRYLQGSYYKLGNIDSAYYYLKISDSLQRTVQNHSNINETQQIQFDQQLGDKEAAANLVLQNQKSRNRITIYVALTGLIFLIVIMAILWRNNKRELKANHLLTQQKQKAEKALSELKSTQAQLIQSEKMASLGELTAGIAHEIQNPLNFVNNFSEVNTELIEELKSEKLKVKNERDEQLESELLNDIAENEKKINHHGKRADAIVKGMLQHSQTSTGQKEPTDINKLADEYLRLSYHGLRAKDKSFNATLKTDFDESIGNINIIPQEIGRVILNLINNAFYVVDEKKKSGIEGYEPTVSVITKKVDDKVLISVKDNGNGIPQKIADKIFQPFFTTKPTGQGTGLGLSLSYDIVKAHGGEIKVESKEGEGSEFIIQLPII